MAKKENKENTIYQGLNQLLNLDGFGYQKEKSGLILPKEPKIIIKGNSPEEIMRKGLELEQKRELQNKFTRTTDRGFQKALQFEAARLPMYIDFEGMEYYPLISSALDLFMEEATTIGFNGKMLNIYSSKERIKYLLEEFFYDIVNVNVNLPFWTRNLPIKDDSIIPILNGEAITIKEIAERMKTNPNEEIWTYSIQDETNKILPGKIVWCDLTRKNSEILRVNLDDDTYVETAPDHEFKLRNGSYKRADELKPMDSLMPFYTIISKEHKVKGYEKVYNPATNHHCFTHRIVAHECIRDLEYENSVNEKFITHHINFKKLDNSIKNLVRMSNSEHSAYHGKLAEKNLQRPDVVEKRLAGIKKYLSSQSRRDRMSKEMSGIYPEYFNEYNNSELHNKHNIIRKEGMTNLWANEEYKNNTKNKMQLKLNDECVSIINKIICTSKNYISIKTLCELLKNDDNFIKIFKKENSHFNSNKDLSKSINTTTLVNMVERKTELDYHLYISTINPNLNYDKNFITSRNISIAKTKKNKTEKIINHKVVSIEQLTTNHDVYCMEVVGPNNEQDRHNFPICSKNENGEFNRNGVFVSNCKYGDDFVYLYGERKKGITHVKQMVNYEIERFEKIQNGKPLIKFKERMTGDEFNVFEVAHFRLLGDDKFLPYGSSLLNKVRRTWRMLVMAEDAMLTYRIVRAGEKKVFKIDVGNIDEDDLEEYIYKVATKFKKTAQVNPNDGQMDYRFNILGNDEDYFLPVRNANTQTGIETLPGASNLNDIMDIEYLRDNLVTGIGIPKPFLSFSDAAGGGKSMAQYDIRFAKKVNRIQQAMIQELNKMAMIHLYLLGYSGEDLKSFTLTLTNPSTQQELLKSELMRDKAQTYAELTRSDTGIAPMSHTSAKRLIFNFSDKEIVNDLKQQKMERAINQELIDSPIIIKKTGLFKDIDEKYGEPFTGMPMSGGTEQGMSPEGGMGAPPTGGAGMSSPMGGAPEGGEMPPAGGEMGGAPPPVESIYRTKPILTEQEYNDHVEKLVYGSNIEPEVRQTIANKIVLKENDQINENLNSSAQNMIDEIDDLLKEGKEFNTELTLDETDVDDIIENIVVDE